MYRTYTGGEAPLMTTIQNTQAPAAFLTLPQVIPTVGTSCLTILLVGTLSLAVCFPSLSPTGCSRYLATDQITIGRTWGRHVFGRVRTGSGRVRTSSDGFETGSRRIRDEFEMSSRRVRDDFGTSSRRVQDEFGTSSGRVSPLLGHQRDKIIFCGRRAAAAKIPKNLRKTCEKLAKNFEKLAQNAFWTPRLLSF